MAKKNVSRPGRTSPSVRVSFPVVNEAQLEAAKESARKRGKKPEEVKYGVVMMFDKTNREHMEYISALKKDAEACLAEHWPDPATRPQHPVVGKVIKDGDTGLNNKGILLKVKNPEYAGHWILRAGSGSKPDAIMAHRDANGLPIYINDKDTLYAGCKCRVNVNAYTFSGQENEGVTFGLNGIQKWEEGERLGGGKPALDSMFDNVAPPVGADPFAGAPTPVEEDPFLKM